MKKILFFGTLVTGITILFQFCKKPVSLPEVTSIGVKNVALNTADAYGRLTGLSITSKGFCWDTLTNPTIDKSFSDEGKGSDAFHSKLDNLLPNRRYYVKAYAKNDAGIVYGEESNFQTLMAPLVTTNTISPVNFSLVSAYGSVSAPNYAPQETGICYDTQKNPDISKHKVSNGSNLTFGVNLSGLTEKTVYYFKAYAKFSFGTYYGAEKSFTTAAAPIPMVIFTNTGTVTDYDGNNYKTIRIGNQTWMAENLHVQTYNDGSAIPYYAVNSSAWQNLIGGGFGYYNSNYLYIASHGYLYNYYTIDDVRGLAPAGWHIPTVAEWQTLMTTLTNANPAYSLTAVSQLFGSNYWISTSCSINNYSNMNLLPSGFRSIQGTDADMGYSMGFWCMDNSGAYASIMYFDYTCFSMSTSKYKNCGYSIRCVKD
jgi:uncharacterized protein (TIGR02145 family)